MGREEFYKSGCVFFNGGRKKYMPVREGRSEVKRKEENTAMSERVTFSWQYCG